MEKGNIVKVVEGKGFYVCVPYADTFKLSQMGVSEVYVTVADPRMHTIAQHKKVFGLMGEIARWSSGFLSVATLAAEKEYLRGELTQKFCADMGIELFSMQDADMTTVGNFIDYLVYFCIYHDVPCMDNNLLGYSADISKYLYACLSHRKCALCGIKADIHHIDSIGMGYDRKEKPQLGAKCIALCRKHHAECHSVGNVGFLEKYHVYGIKLDEFLCKKLKLRMQK